MPSRSATNSYTMWLVRRSLAALVLQGVCLQQDVSGHAFELERVHDASRRADGVVHAVESELCAGRIATNEAPDPTGPDLHLIDDRGVTSGAPPLRDEGRVHHHLEQALAGRIEQPGDDDFLLAGFGDEVGFAHFGLNIPGHADCCLTCDLVWHSVHPFYLHDRISCSFAKRLDALYLCSGGRVLGSDRP